MHRLKFLTDWSVWMLVFGIFTFGFGVYSLNSMPRGEILYSGSFCKPSSPAPLTITDDEIPTVSGRMSQEMVDGVEALGVEKIKFSSPGGSVPVIDRLPRVVDKIEITPPKCHSGCAWMSAFHDNVCLGEDVEKVVFHTAVKTRLCDQFGNRKVAVDTTRKLLDRLPALLRNDLVGLLPEEKLIDISREDFLRHFPPEKSCSL